ncbi:MAG: putative zinc protease [Alphaproteobacteria bacterium MarineAlpha4_Bin2]|nr:MAG: putative zinc protease [Alphaproteobacteria bacterium MarineAlpha4_Bin2]
MTKYFRQLICVIAGVLVLMKHDAASGAVFKPETFTLENGLQVIIVPNHRAPVATMIVYYKVGAIDEPPGKSGLAHYLEHLMFKGTKTLSPGEFSKIVARNGGSDNAFTSQDYTGYVTSFAADRLDLILRLEADRMTGLRLTPADIEPERKVVLEERLSRIDNNPGAQLSEHANNALYANHPYRIPIIGWRHEIEALTREDLMAFYRAWYAPNNAVIVISGDVATTAIRPMVERHFGELPRRDLPLRPAWREPQRNAHHLVTLSHHRVRQPLWSRRFLAPSHGTGDEKRQIYALEVLAEILSGGTTGRLYRRLIVEKGLATEVHGRYSGDNRGPGKFLFYASPRPGKTLDEIEIAIEAEIAKLLSDGVTEDEVGSAIQRMQARAVFARDSLRAPPRILGDALMTGLTLADVESWPENIGKVTKADVEAAARAVLTNGGSVTARLTPKVEGKS